MVRALHRALRVGAALREVVPRRQAQRRLQLRRPARRRGARRPRRLPLGGRAGGRAAGDHLRRPAARRRPHGERAQGARRRQGHEGRDLHGDGPRAAGGDARLHAPRRAAHGRLRRLLRRLALRPRERHGLRGADHAGRGVAPRHDGAAEADRGRRDGRRARDPARRSSSAAPATTCPMQEGRDHWLHDFDVSDDPGHVPAGADGQRGPALPHVHVRHDGEAEGDRAHDGRLPRRRRLDARADLRPEAGGGRLLVRGRHRLDHRPQLHRLRARSRTAPPPSSTRGRRTSRTRTAGGTSSSATASRSSTRRRRRSART